MASDDQEGSSQLVALCQRLDRLYSEQELEIWDEEPTPESLQECRFILVGNIFSNPSVNLQAFQSTMKWAWRTDQVEISQRDAGLKPPCPAADYPSTAPNSNC